MDISDVEIYEGQFETSIECTECQECFEGCVTASNEKEAAEETIKEAKREGWTDGPLCPECSKEAE